MRYVNYLSSRYRLALVCALLVLAALALSACKSANGDDKAQQHKPPPVPVDVKKVAPHGVDIYAKYPGRVQGKRTVQVLARVEGILLKRHYNEGQLVHKGDLLYTIDPAPFQATVDQRQAQVASAKAKLDKAQRAWKRVHRLYKKNAVSKADRDQALSALETARAAVKQAKANLESAQIDLGYTKVTAPLTGVTSLREIDAGSLVKNGTKLTTITQLNPVYVLFALPEDDAIARNKALKQMGNKTTSAATRQATVILPNGKPYPVKGTVDFTQSTIDPSTGTVQLRAVVKNPDNALMPGRYVRVRIRIETRPKAIVVPNVAISSGQQQTQVFVVGKNGKAKPVTVQLGPNVANGRVINKGLSAGDRVITSGLAQVKPGAPVKIKTQVASKPKPKSKPESEPKSETNAGAPSKPANAVAATGFGGGHGLRVDGSLPLVAGPTRARAATPHHGRSS